MTTPLLPDQDETNRALARHKGMQATIAITKADGATLAVDSCDLRTMDALLEWYSPFHFSDEERSLSGHTVQRSLVETRASLDAWISRCEAGARGVESRCALARWEAQP